MYVSVLGPLVVEGEDGPIEIGPPLDRALLCLLAIHAGRTVTATSLVEGLWGEDPPASARKGLQGRVSALRSALPDGSIATASGGYSLAVDPDAVDLHRFEQLLSRAARPDSRGSIRQRRDGIESALGLWRGPPMPELADKHAGLAQIARLEELRLSAQEDLVDLRLMMGEHQEALADLEALVTSEPLRERRWGQLMVALYRSGRQADALRSYQLVRRRLADELGVDPGPELRRIERLVLGHSPELDWDAGPVGGASPEAEKDPGGVSTSGPPSAADRVEPETSSPGGWVARLPNPQDDPLPFVGRDVELSWLSELARRTDGATRPDLALVIGRAGHGKTRLLTELSRAAREHGVLVAGGSAEHDTSLPYGPFADVVRDLLAQVGDQALGEGHLRDDLVWLVPELGPPPIVELAELSLARARLIEAVLQLLAGVGTSQPLLILIDDAHRLGEGAMSLLRAILSRPWLRHIAVVVACRSDEENRGIPQGDASIELLSHQGSVAIELGRLSSTDLHTLTTRLGSQDSGLEPGNGMQWLADETGGIPLLVREVLARPTPRNRGSRPEPATTGRVSPLVESVIGRRLSRLEVRAQKLLEVASVIGMQFDAEVLAAASDCRLTEVNEVLDGPLRAGIITESDRYGRYAFDHGLIREVLESGVPESTRMRLHGKVAMVLQLGGADLEAARHALEGWPSLETEDAVGIVLTGIDHALHSLDFELALGLCTDTIADHATELTPGSSSDLLVRLGRAQSLAGRRTEADDTWRRAADLAREAGDWERFGQVALGTMQHARMTTPSDLRWSLLNEALDRTGPEWTRQRILVACAWLNEASTTARRAASGDFEADVVRAARELDDPRVLVAAYHARHVVARSSSVAGRRKYCAEFLGVAEDVGDPSWLFHARLACLLDAVAAGEGDLAFQQLESLRQVCAEFRDPFALWTCEMATATFARLQGRFEAADEHDAAARQLGTRHGIVDADAAHGASLFVRAYHRGGLGTVRPVIEQFAAEHTLTLAWTVGAGLAAAADEDFEAARACLEHALPELADGPQDGIWLPAACMAADIAGWIGIDGSRVSELERLLSPYAGQFAIVGPLTSEFGPTDRCLGMLASRRGDHLCADERFASAIALAQGIGSRPWELRARTDWLLADRAAGRPPRPWWQSLQSDLSEAQLYGSEARLLATDA